MHQSIRIKTKFGRASLRAFRREALSMQVLQAKLSPEVVGGGAHQKTLLGKKGTGLRSARDAFT
jgi:hypothetical protein